jgi:hypothetical protein
MTQQLLGVVLSPQYERILCPHLLSGQHILVLVCLEYFLGHLSFANYITEEITLHLVYRTQCVDNSQL